MSRAFRVMQQMSLVGSLDPGCKARSHDFAIFLLMKRNLLINMIMKILLDGTSIASDLLIMNSLLTFKHFLA